MKSTNAAVLSAPTEAFAYMNRKLLAATAGDLVGYATAPLFQGYLLVRVFLVDRDYILCLSDHPPPFAPPDFRTYAGTTFAQYAHRSIRAPMETVRTILEETMAPLKLEWVWRCQ